MSENNWFTTEHPAIVFEKTVVGELKKEIWDADTEKINEILKEYEIPSPSELVKPGSYIQTTPRKQVILNRNKNDIVLIPVGCTENHGNANVSGLDTLFVTQLCEGVRRYTAKSGAPVNIAIPPLMYGAHPYHHVGMPGTVVIPDEIVKEFMVNVMLGLWNDGFRKQIIVNNHGQLWVLEAVIHEFMKRYQLPGIYIVIDWHRAVREFFFPVEGRMQVSTHFVHADESETSLAMLLLGDEYVDKSEFVDTAPQGYLPDGHFDKSVDPLRRPLAWSFAEGHIPIEIAATPEGVVGKQTASDKEKVKRPVAAFLRYLTLLCEQILKAYPAGTVPPVNEITMRTKEEMEPYLKEPLSKGWKSVYHLPIIGQR